LLSQLQTVFFGADIPPWTAIISLLFRAATVSFFNANFLLKFVGFMIPPFWIPGKKRRKSRLSPGVNIFFHFHKMVLACP
jgi:hypothetical protein